jgi:hypothetical protein
MMNKFRCHFGRHLRIEMSTVERRRGSGGGGVCVSIMKRSITIYFDKELSQNKVTMQPKINTAIDLESRDVLAQVSAKVFQANGISG